MMESLALHPTSTETLHTCRYRAHLADRAQDRHRRYRSRAWWRSRCVWPSVAAECARREGERPGSMRYRVGHYATRLRRSRGKR